MPLAHSLSVAAQQDDKEKRLKLACEFLNNMAEPNVKEIAKICGLHAGTLGNRWKGRTRARAVAHEAQMLLTPAQEQALVDWLTYLSDTAHPLCKRTIRYYVQDLCGKRPSKNWVYAFLKRHKGPIKLAKTTGLDPRRAQAFNRVVVGRYFKMLQEICQKHEIPIENIYNMDEKGVQRGGGRKSAQRKYFVSRHARANYKYRSANLELITIIECVCADGTALKPGFVFPGKEFCPEWFEVDPEIIVSMSPNGWTDDFLGTDWFKLSFLPQSTARNTSGKPILLVYDGHGSHETTPIIRMALERNTILLCLPPHTTHKLQPLDVGVFGPAQRLWTERCDDIVIELQTEMRKEDFVKEYMAVREKSFKESTIRSAWRASGAWPINPDVFTDQDYAPSIPFSTKAQDFPSELAPFIHQQASFFPERINPNFDWDNDFDDSPDEPDCLSTSTTTGIASTTLCRGPTFAQPLFNDENWTPSPSPSAARSTRSSTRPPHIRAPVPLTPISPSRFYSGSSMLPSPSKRQSPYHAQWARIRGLEERVAEQAHQINYLASHLTITTTHITNLRRSENARAAKKSGKAKLNADARTLTSAEGLRLAEERDALASAKEQERETRNQEREEQERLAQERRVAERDTMVFTGAITSKNKSQLKDLAWALGLTMDGTNAELQTRINAHFDSNPEKREHPQFIGIFQRGRAAASSSAIHPPIPSSMPTPSSSGTLANVTNIASNSFAMAGPGPSTATYYDGLGMHPGFYAPNVYDHTVPTNLTPSYNAFPSRFIS